MAGLGGQAPVGVLLVLVGGQARVPVEGAFGGVCRVGCAGAGARGQVGQAQADEGTDEDSLLLVFQEVGEHAPWLGVGEGEGRREVVDDGPTDAFGLEAREEERHSWSVVVMGDGVDAANGVREWCLPGPAPPRADRRCSGSDPAVQRLPQRGEGRRGGPSRFLVTRRENYDLHSYWGHARSACLCCVQTAR